MSHSSRELSDIGGLRGYPVRGDACMKIDVTADELKSQKKLIHKFGWGYIVQSIEFGADGITPTWSHCVSYLLDDVDNGVQEAYGADPEVCLDECINSTNEYARERDLTRAIQEYQTKLLEASSDQLLRRFLEMKGKVVMVDADLDDCWE